MKKNEENITIIINIRADGSEQSKALLNQYIKPIIAEQKMRGFDKDNMYEMIDQKLDLSSREIQVLKGMIGGLKNTEIADNLFISVSTVKYHSKKIFEKLNINTRGQIFNRIYDLLYSY